MLWPALTGAQPYEVPTFIHGEAIGGERDQYLHGLEVDAEGNTYVAGYFWGQLCFFNDTCVYAHSDGQSERTDIFVASYDTARNLRWVRTFGGTGTDRVHDMDMGPDGNLYLAGAFSDTAVFGTELLLSTGDSLSFGAPDDGIWLKVNQKGDIQSLHQVSNIFYDQIDKISVGERGDVWIAGTFRGDSVCLDDLCAVSDTSYGIFVAHYLPSGELVSAKVTHPNLSIIPSYLNDIVADPFGNLFYLSQNRLVKFDGGGGVEFSHSFDAQVFTGATTLGGDFAFVALARDTFSWCQQTILPGYLISRLDSNGSCVWTYNIPNTVSGPTYFSDLRIFKGTIFVYGSMYGEYIIGSDTIRATQDLGLLSHDLPSGAYRWGRAIGSDWIWENPVRMTVNPKGEVIIASSMVDYHNVIDSLNYYNPYAPQEFIMLAWSTLDSALLTGIESEPSDDSPLSYQLYPNPASNYLTIAKASSLEPQTWRILDMQGRVIMQGRWDSEMARLVLDISAVVPGVYLFQVAEKYNHYSVKFVKS